MIKRTGICVCVCGGGGGSVCVPQKVAGTQTFLELPGNRLAVKGGEVWFWL